MMAFYSPQAQYHSHYPLSPVPQPPPQLALAVTDVHHLGSQFMNISIHETHNNNNIMPLIAMSHGQPILTNQGHISMLLDEMLIDIGGTHAMRVSWQKNSLAVNHDGSASAISLPTLRILQLGDNVHINYEDKIAKLSGRGITFTTLNRPLIYLVDSSGCKTTTDRFRKLDHDFVSEVFNEKAIIGEDMRQKFLTDLMRCNRSCTSESRSGDIMMVWQIGGVMIKYKKNGEVELTKNCGQDRQISVIVSPNKKTVKLMSPIMKVVVNGYENTLSVVKQEQEETQRVVASQQRFKVRHGSQRAGFDALERVILV